MNAWERFSPFEDVDLNDRSSSEFVGFKVTNCVLVLHYQLQREQREKHQTFVKFILALRTFLMPSISKYLLSEAYQTITTNKDGKTMGDHRFARALYDM